MEGPQGDSRYYKNGKYYPYGDALSGSQGGPGQQDGYSLHNMSTLGVNVPYPSTFKKTREFQDLTYKGGIAEVRHSVGATYIAGTDPPSDTPSYSIGTDEFGVRGNHMHDIFKKVSFKERLKRFFYAK